MPTTVTPAYDSSQVRTPLDGEVASAADLLAITVQPMVNQTHYNQQRVVGLATYGGVRSVSIENASFLNTVWGFSFTNPSFRKYIVQNDYTGTGYNVLIEITDVLPMSGKIRSVNCEVIGAARDPATLPSQQYRPSIGLRRVLRTYQPGSIGDNLPNYEGQDASATYSQYTTPHKVSSPANLAYESQTTIDLASYRYYIELKGEQPNANAHNGLILYGAYVDVTTI